VLYAVLSAFTSMPAFSLATNKASVCVFFRHVTSEGMLRKMCILYLTSTLLLKCSENAVACAVTHC
jgi:hypothetical protein